MSAVLFEVHPKAAQRDAYLGYAKLLRPELERIDGFVDNVRYRSLTRGRPHSTTRRRRIRIPLSRTRGKRR